MKQHKIYFNDLIQVKKLTNKSKKKRCNTISRLQSTTEVSVKSIKH